MAVTFKSAQSVKMDVKAETLPSIQASLLSEHPSDL